MPSSSFEKGLGLRDEWGEGGLRGEGGEEAKEGWVGRRGRWGKRGWEWGESCLRSSRLLLEVVRLRGAVESLGGFWAGLCSYSLN